MKIKKRIPSFRSAVLLLIFAFILFMLGVGLFNYPVEFVLIVITFITTVYAICYGAKWKDIVAEFSQKSKNAAPAVLMLLAIGMLIGCWMVSGTIPLMVYYGLTLINPSYLYLTAFLVTAVISIFTGSSWGSAGTIGVALISVASAMGISLPITAGAVISGAYFGDKLSPLSDTTNMAALAAEVDLYRSIHYMLYTSLPALVVSCIGFIVVGIGLGDHSSSANLAAIDEMKHIVSSLFYLNPILLLPPVIVFFGAVKKMDTTMILAISSAVALVLSIIFQHFTFSDMVQSAIHGFSIDMIKDFDLIPMTVKASSNMHTLLTRGGVYSMVSPIIVMVCAFLFAAALDVSGGLNVVLERLIKKLRTLTSLFLTTSLSSAILVACTGNAVITFFLVKNMFDKPYRDKNLDMANMSRAMETGATLLEGLFPWTISGIFMAKTLGVPTLSYVPWTFFNLSCLVFAILLFIFARWIKVAIPLTPPVSLEK